MNYRSTGLNDLMGTRVLGGYIESGYDFDGRTERGAVSSMHIKNLTADSIQSGTISSDVSYSGTITAGQINGGTLTLGGTANGNGVAEVLNASGGTAIVLNKDGITVNGGSVSISNSLGTTILDTQGMVSAANFPFVQVTSAGANGTTSGTAWIDVTSITTDIVLNRSQQVFIMAQVRGGDFTGELTTVPPVPCRFRVLAGTAIMGTTKVFSNIHQDPIDTPSTVSYGFNDGLLTGIMTIPSGTTTTKLQFSSDSSGAKVACVSSLCVLTYFKMGA